VTAARVGLIIDAGVFFNSARLNYRPRHEVSAWMLVILWPLFRYSDWRDAWILRVVGERFGPVLVRLPYVPWRMRASNVLARTGDSTRGRLADAFPVTRSAVAWFLASSVMVAAALGFALARSGSGPAARALNVHESAGTLALSYPAAWKRAASPVASQLGLSDVIAVSPSASPGDVLIVGRTATADPQFLPKRLLASLPSTPAPQTVTLGHGALYRYSDLHPRGQQTPESVYAVPTTAGTVLGVCIAPQSQGSFTASCERSLATLELGSGSRLPVGPSPTYAAALNRVANQLNAVQARTGSQLVSARAAKTQASAASTLGATDTRAAATLSRLDAGPAAAANSAVVSALNSIGSAYRALGGAASRHDSSAYRAAGASVKHATSALAAAYSRLGAFGYRVS
jgi:hypothetical protein